MSAQLWLHSSPLCDRDVDRKSSYFLLPICRSLPVEGPTLVPAQVELGLLSQIFTKN